MKFNSRLGTPFLSLILAAALLLSCLAAACQPAPAPALSEPPAVADAPAEAAAPAEAVAASEPPAVTAIPEETDTPAESGEPTEAESEVEGEAEAPGDRVVQAAMTAEEMALLAEAAKQWLGEPCPEVTGSEAGGLCSIRFVRSVLNAAGIQLIAAGKEVDITDAADPFLLPGMILYLRRDDIMGRCRGVYLGDGKYVTTDHDLGKVVERDLAEDLKTLLTKCFVWDEMRPILSDNN